MALFNNKKNKKVMTLPTTTIAPVNGTTFAGYAYSAGNSASLPTGLNNNAIVAGTNGWYLVNGQTISGGGSYANLYKTMQDSGELTECCNTGVMINNGKKYCRECNKEHVWEPAKMDTIELKKRRLEEEILNLQYKEAMMKQQIQNQTLQQQNWNTYQSGAIQQQTPNHNHNLNGKPIYPSSGTA